MSLNTIKTDSELSEIADLLYKSLKENNDVGVARYIRVSENIVSFLDGRIVIDARSSATNINKELMKRNVYFQRDIDDVTSTNIKEAVIHRDLDRGIRFTFKHKGIPLPTTERIYPSKLPTEIDVYDEELKDFSKSQKDTRTSRGFFVEQKVIVNSEGGKVVQTTPLFNVTFDNGYLPVPTSRTIRLVCETDQDVKSMVKAIKYISDPTPDKRVKKSKSFSEAFGELLRVSELHNRCLSIPQQQLYDVVVISGIPVHEIFGHHFEEPIGNIKFGESSAFKFNQKFNDKIIMKDDPSLKLEGLRVLGFTNIDAYGRERKPRTHIEDGYVKELLGSEYGDPLELGEYFGLKNDVSMNFVGNASQSFDGVFPQTRMSCTFLDGPAEDVEMEGKIVIVPIGGSTDYSKKDYELKIFESYLVKDGEPKRIVTPLKVTGGIIQAFANINLLDDVTYECGACQKPNPIQGYPSKPYGEALVSQLTKSQLWKQQQVFTSPISEQHTKVLTN